MSEFIQPRSGVRVGVAFGPMDKQPVAFWCERRVNGHCQIGWYGWPLRVISREIREWIAFERRIGSMRLPR